MRPFSVVVLLIVCSPTAIANAQEDAERQQRLEGDWLVVSYESKTTHVVGPGAWKYRIRIHGDEFTLFEDDKAKPSAKAAIEKSTPMRIDLTWPDGTLGFGIFALHGDKMVIQTVQGKKGDVDQSDRPSKFGPTPDDDKEFMNTYVRIPTKGRQSKEGVK